MGKKKIKDKNNKQIRGTPGLGRKRAEMRDERAKARFKGIRRQVQVVQQSQQVVPEINLVELSKMQERKLEEASEDSHEAPAKKTKTKRKRKSQASNQACESDQPSDHSSDESSDHIVHSKKKAQNHPSASKSVEFENDGSMKRKRASAEMEDKLEYGVQVCLSGLKGSAELNGKSGTCLSWDDAKQRWYVRLNDGSNKVLNVKAENLKVLALRQGSTVRLRGLQSAPELNGKFGTCKSWNPMKERWLVAIAGSEKLFKADNLEVCSSEGALHVSPTISQEVCTCVERAKPEELVQFIRKIREEEKRGLRMVSLMVVFCSSQERLQAVASALSQAQMLSVVFHKDLASVKRDRARSEFNLDKKRIMITLDDVRSEICTDDVRCVLNYDFPKSLNIYCDRLKILSESAGTVFSLFTKASSGLAKDFVTLLERCEARVPAGLRELVDVK